LRREIVSKRGEVQRLAGRLQPALGRRIKTLRDALREQTRVLASVSYERVLARGFALVTKADGGLARSALSIADGDALRLKFADGEVGVTAGSNPGAPKSPSPAPLAGPQGADPLRPRIRRRTTGGDQGNLF
jgi:exodeoxyribonuclease VII large subunit